MPAGYKEHEQHLQEALHYAESLNDPNYRALAEEFNVSYRRLLDRKNGVPSKLGNRPHNSKLSQAQEKALLLYIQRLDDIGFPPTFRMVEKAANKLIRDATDMDILVGPKWAQRFYQRHAGLQSRRHKVQELSRTACANPRAFQEWFKKLKKKIDDLGIVVSDLDQST